MKRAFVFTLAFIFGFSLLVGLSPFDSKAHAGKTTFVTIGTGGITGVYYPTGGAIARMVNAKRKQYGIRATVESTGGSVFNVNAVMTGDLEFGVVQSDRQFQAIKGIANWKDKGPQKDLRAVFSIHPETVDLIAAVDANINSLQDLKGKRINIGNVGSGYRKNAIDALAANGLDYGKDFHAGPSQWLLQGGHLRKTQGEVRSHYQYRKSPR
jgi:TRAP transporter TAXI family solute receptor